MRRVSVVALGVMAFGVLPAIALADGLPKPAESFNWSGLYVGAHLGGALEKASISDPYGSAIFGDDIRAPGPLAGGQIGYNWQVGKTVLGLEASASWADLDGTNTCFAVSGFFLSSNCHIHTDAMGTLTGRLGLAVGPDSRTLVYGKGGAAWENSTIDATLAGSTGLTNSTSGNATRWGWTVGAGVAHALTDRWSVEADYDFLSFGSANITTPASALQVTPGNPGTFVAVPGIAASVSNDTHQFKIGVNYRFGGSGTAHGSDWSEGSIKDSPVRIAPGLEFEAGARYVHSWGRFQKDLVPQSPVSRLTYDGMTTNGGELFARVDTPRNLMVKGLVGLGSGDGHMNDEDFAVPAGVLYAGSPFIPYTNTLSSKVDDQVRYFTVDAGYNVLRGSGYKLSSFVGYNYFQQNMDGFGCLQQADPLAGCSAGNGGNFPPVPTSGSPIITEHDTWQSLRLGLAGDLMLASRLKFSGEVAYLPYVKFSGVDNHFVGNSGVLAETFPESGRGTGVQLEAALSYALTDQFSVAVGGRYWSMRTNDGAYSCSFGCPGSPTGTFPFRAAAEQAAVFLQGSYKFGGEDNDLQPIK